MFQKPDDIRFLAVAGIGVMLLLFISFLVSFIISQRKKLQYHKNLQNLHEEQEQILTRQNVELEKKVEERTVELIHQKDALQQSLSELRVAQSELIRKEKLASLGELTAGIAHEIQNPLNFVNNFTEINGELFSELKNYFSQESWSNTDRQQVLELAQDVSKNLEKVAYHGKRAEGIVKGMLQHFRNNTGEKELTDINTLCGEYVELGYQGFRARHKSFQARVESQWDPSVEKFAIVPQDIARVLLNLVSNACFALREKKQKMGEAFDPVLTVFTLRQNDILTIGVRDNGTGIPEKILDKIWNPFFTTKPAGEGTGLGLSISYDIIKAAGGDLKVSSREGEFTEFTLLLPSHQ